VQKVRYEPVHSIKMYMALRYIGENQEGKWIDKSGCTSSRRVAQEFEVQAGKSDLGRGCDGGTQVGIRYLRRRKKGWRG
jgi:hypothetical protein